MQGIFVLSFLSSIVVAVYGAPSLPVLNVDTSKISVSGVSSGAVMATQFHVAFSSEIMGAGLVAGFPYGCAPATFCTSTPSLINVLTLQTETATARMYLNIDSTFNMADDKIWIFAGTQDSVVLPVAGSKIQSYYSLYVDSMSQIKLVNSIAAEHGVITNNYGGPCGTLNDNYFNNCGYSAAYNLLDFIYGNQKEPSPSDTFTGELLQFDQTAFTSSLGQMDNIGYVYVPTRCKNGANVCKLHIAFHGCKIGRELIGDEFVRHAGYNEVADLNDIIIIYPQVHTSTLNPLGCWDWFAYTGAYYGNQSHKAWKY